MILGAWVNRKQDAMQFAVCLVWRELRFCCLFLTYVSGHKYKNKCVRYAN